jgi:7-cyano-7-deazaguanine synthase
MPGIPVTYVPARNTIMLSLALAWAEVLGAQDIFVGVNAVDYSGYPDCRPEFIRAFEAARQPGDQGGGRGPPLRVHAPLIDMSKAQIIALGGRLGVDYGLTVSCYQADAEAVPAASAIPAACAAKALPPPGWPTRQSIRKT